MSGTFKFYISFTFQRNFNLCALNIYNNAIKKCFPIWNILLETHKIRKLITLYFLLLSKFRAGLNLKKILQVSTCISTKFSKKIHFSGYFNRNRLSQLIFYTLKSYILYLVVRTIVNFLILCWKEILIKFKFINYL